MASLIVPDGPAHDSAGERTNNSLRNQLTRLTHSHGMFKDRHDSGNGYSDADCRAETAGRAAEVRDQMKRRSRDN